MLSLLEVGVRVLALFALLNVVLGLLSERWDANWLWIQGGAVPRPVVTALVLVFALGVLFGRRRPSVHFATRTIAVLLAIACLADAISFFRLLARGQIHSSLPVPLSLALGGLLLGWALFGAAGADTRGGRTRRALWIRVMQHGAPVLLALVGVLAHVLAFGATDYRRPADAAVVFGAAVWPGGKASPALRDRTLTACRLYHDGLVGHLVLSGGRNPAAEMSEPECMARLARAQGVPAHALILDESGTNSRASVVKARALAREHGWSRVLMVSHDYHLARIHLLCHRAGLNVATVPAEESGPWPSKPLFVGREVVAWAWWYLRPSAA